MISNMPSGDVWKVQDNDIDSYYYGKTFVLDFNYINIPDIKDLVKKYIWHNYTTKTLMLRTLSLKTRGLKRFINFVNKNNITSLRELTNNHIDFYVAYMNSYLLSNGKPLTQETKRHELSNIKNLVYWGQVYSPKQVPEKDIFTGNEIPATFKIKVDYIDDDVLKRINECLVNEENVYLKCGLLILQSTGIRFGALLKLKVNCLTPHLVSGYNLNMFDFKNKKERKPIVVNKECVQAIRILQEYTQELRNRVENPIIKDLLFIYEPEMYNYIGTPTEISSESYKRWLKEFISKNDIRDSNGKLVNLNIRQFRRTLATDMFSKGVDIGVIKEVLGHSRTEITKRYYADVKDKERAQAFNKVGIIGNINQINTIISNEEDREWFDENKNKGARMCDGYCTKPFINGEICDRLLKRKKCYSCSRYITTPEYLEVHRTHLKELEEQIENNIYGEHYAEHFKPTIEILKQIISRLEEIQNDRTKI